MNRRTLWGLCASALLLIAFLAGVMVFERMQAAREQALLATASAYIPSATTTVPTADPTTATAPNTAPALSVTDKDGKVYTLDDFVGKPTVFCFWSAASTPSKQELAILEELCRDYPDTLNVAAIHVSSTTAGKTAALAFLEEQGYLFPAYFDITGDAAKAYTISQYPTTYFLDQNGVLKARSRGSINAGDIPVALERIGLQ